MIRVLEAHLDGSSTARGGTRIGLAAWLVHQVPAKDGGVIAVGHSSDTVVAGGNGLDPVLVQSNGIGICEEVIAASGSGRVVGVIAPAEKMQCIIKVDLWADLICHTQVSLRFSLLFQR